MRNQTSSASANAAQPEAVALFISDLHLQPALPKTTAAFLDFLQRHAMKARQLYLLGDLFEYWVGDDAVDEPYNSRIADALHRVADAGVTVFWISGNRDFLVNEGFARRAGLTLLPDPFVATIAGRTVALAHGDAQCTDDHAYMAFRAQVREPGWQRTFLALPLEERRKIVEGARMGSKEAQRSKSAEIMDVNEMAIASLFDATGAELMIHGHTHRPARHEYRSEDGVRLRYVLPDWDCDAEPPRGGWIAIDAQGMVRRFGVDGVEVG